MKIKKLEPQQISEKSLGFKDYRKVVKPALKAMLEKHNSVETATDFLVKTNFEFADMKGKKMGFIIPGEQTSSWLKMSKEQVKEDKKNTCIGTCYVRKNADGTYVLVLLPVKGAAKKNLMIKQLEKFALKGTPLTLEIGAGGELEEDNPADVVLDDVVLPAEDGEEEVASTNEAAELTEEQKTFKKTMEERMVKMDEQMTKVKEQLKM